MYEELTNIIENEMYPAYKKLWKVDSIDELYDDSDEPYIEPATNDISIEEQSRSKDRL